MTALAIVLGLFSSRIRSRRWASLGVSASVAILNPLLGLATAAAAAGARQAKSVIAQRRETNERIEQVLVALDLLSLGTTAGLSFLGAASTVAGEISGPASADLRRAVTRVKSGLPHAIDDGALSRAFDAAARSADSGGSLSDSLVDLAREARAERAAIERERIERLPVKLLFPLAFLILPGFVLVAVVPSIVSGIEQLRL